MTARAASTARRSPTRINRKAAQPSAALPLTRIAVACCAGCGAPLGVDQRALKEDDCTCAVVEWTGGRAKKLTRRPAIVVHIYRLDPKRWRGVR